MSGAQGFEGTQGVQGTQGVEGAQGSTGTQGAQGTQGLQGEQGTQGLQGTQGAPGLSYVTDATGTIVDSIAQRNGTALYAESGFYQSSDKRIKKEIGNLDLTLDDIDTIPTVRYKLTTHNDDKVLIGTYAQDIIDMFPEAVELNKDGHYVVNYDMIAVIAIAGLKKVHKELNELKKKF